MRTVTVGALTFELKRCAGGYAVQAVHAPSNARSSNPGQYEGLSLGIGQNPALWPRGPMQSVQREVNRA